MINCTQSYNVNFRTAKHSNVQCGLWKYTVFGHTMWFFKKNTLYSDIEYGILKIHCTRTYNMSFERILYSAIQYELLKEYIVLGHTIWFFENLLHSNIQYKIHYTQTYSVILKEYYTRTYSMIFKDLLYSDVQYDF